MEWQWSLRFAFLPLSSVSVAKLHIRKRGAYSCSMYLPHPILNKPRIFIINFHATDAYGLENHAPFFSLCKPLRCHFVWEVAYIYAKTAVFESNWWMSVLCVVLFWIVILRISCFSSNSFLYLFGDPCTDRLLHPPRGRFLKKSLFGCLPLLS